MEKIAIIGASYLQLPLVEKANEMGIETHVFAWREGNVVEEIADYYYPISILEKENICKECKEIKINGIASIGSDIAMPTVAFVAENLGLKGNTVNSTLLTTDKYEMRKELAKNNLPCPYFDLYRTSEFKNYGQFKFPVIVKPTDRSGSRGVIRVKNPKYMKNAINRALASSFNKSVIVEEFITGKELSVEMISYEGKHYPLVITDKVTTGPPFFVELEHHQPAQISVEQEEKIIKIITKALNILEIKNGASHSEVLLTENGSIYIIEVAGRMGGDFIGSDLVFLSTGYDFVKGVIQIAMDRFELIPSNQSKKSFAGVYYVLPEPGIIQDIENFSKKHKYVIKAISILKKGDFVDTIIESSDKRAGLFIYNHPSKKLVFDPKKVLMFETV